MKALVLIDIQNFYFEKGSMTLSNPKEAVKCTKKLLEECRKKKISIIHIKHNMAYLSGYRLSNKILNQIHEDVCPIEGEYVVEKQMPNSFLGTDLKKILDSEGIKQIIVTGMMSNICVASTVMAAKDLGYEVIVAEDACTTKDFCFGEEIIEGHIVHKVCMSSLKGIYASIISTHEVIRHYLL